jgi:hypothetical protein
MSELTSGDNEDYLVYEDQKQQAQTESPELEVFDEDEVRLSIQGVKLTSNKLNRKVKFKPGGAWGPNGEKKDSN